MTDRTTTLRLRRIIMPLSVYKAVRDRGEILEFKRTMRDLAKAHGWDCWDPRFPPFHKNSGPLVIEFYNLPPGVMT